jgi:hypothetical protein
VAELVRVAHDAHGLDPALHDIHREYAPDADIRLLLGHGASRLAAGNLSGAPHERGELSRAEVTGRICSSGDSTSTAGPTRGTSRTGRAMNVPATQRRSAKVTVSPDPRESRLPLE